MSGIDPKSFCKAVEVYGAGNSITSATTTAPSTGVDTRGWGEAYVIVSVGNVTGTSITVALTMQESSASDGSGDAFAAITDAAGTELDLTGITQAANEQQVHVGQINLTRTERYIRPSIVTTGSSVVVPISVHIVLMNPARSASQNQTFAFSH